MTRIEAEQKNSLSAMIGAGGVAAILAPFLYGLIYGPLTGESIAMSVSAWMGALFFAPLIFLVVWMLAVAGGLLLKLLRFQHVTSFIAAGMLVGFACQRVLPLFVSIGQSHTTASNSTEAVLSVVVAGGIDGAIFWFALKRFSTKRDV